jgi:DNA invertase Pin-like site-specific DNA recombinase
VQVTVDPAELLAGLDHPGGTPAQRHLPVAPALVGLLYPRGGPGLATLLDYAREGDAIVVAGIDRLGRNAAEVMTTIRDLGERNIVLRSLRHGIDTSNATCRMVAGVLASLAELELELGQERRTVAREARRARGQAIGRPKVLDEKKVALAQRMHASGKLASTIAAALGVSRATVYRVLAEQSDDGD